MSRIASLKSCVSVAAALLMAIAFVLPAGCGDDSKIGGGDGETDWSLYGPADDNGDDPLDDPVHNPGPYAFEVISVDYGKDAGFGQPLSGLPEIVLGPPQGLGTGQGSLDTLSLGVGGWITLGFGDISIVDGEGDDFVVFENAFYTNGEPGDRYIEAGIVAVSEDGVTFTEFPHSADDSLSLGDPERYSGYAGVEPVHPGDGPDGIGGDRFDLADVGLDCVRYVRFTDTAGDPEDPGDGDIGFGKSGFDLDAVGLLNWEREEEGAKGQRHRGGGGYVLTI